MNLKMQTPYNAKKASELLLSAFLIAPLSVLFSNHFAEDLLKICDLKDFVYAYDLQSKGEDGLRLNYIP
ncbi:MAG: hypothetical protein O3C13_09025 [Bacteroidetes bacterium]|nr:hypothetical protein [Bacteroidota bacterium]